ncbi:hypothetical protein [Burkholderia ubonensis]|uniref:hypothetical protein n=1 Tax=Burkholderia ubonensis TaxID=101571 RepID=UPI00114CA067|nr:hypothetical protein [Burkholderia ubonensis]
MEEIHELCFPACEACLERLMCDSGFRVHHSRCYHVTVDSRHELPVMRNLLNREFMPIAPNQVFGAGPTLLRRIVAPRVRAGRQRADLRRRGQANGVGQPNVQKQSRDWSPSKAGRNSSENDLNGDKNVVSAC